MLTGTAPLRITGRLGRMSLILINLGCSLSIFIGVSHHATVLDCTITHRLLLRGETVGAFPQAHPLQSSVRS
jgi:hypothetical protein